MAAKILEPVAGETAGDHNLVFPPIEDIVFDLIENRNERAARHISMIQEMFAKQI